jgi:signal transduction histidine kinase
MAPPTKRRRHGMTLRWRLTLWCTCWLGLVTLLLIIGLNGALVLLAARSGSILPLPYVAPASVAAAPVGNTSPVAPESAGTPPAVPAPLPARRTTPLRAVPLHLVEAQTLRRLRLISAAVLVLVVLLSGLSAYLLAGQPLRRLRQISAVAQRVRPRTLGERIILTGPADELQELARTINAMLERLEQDVQEQHRFVADVSHELRTPLAVLQTNLDVTTENPAAGLAEYRHLTGIVQHAVLRLERLVEQLLLLARRTQASPDECVTLGPLLEDVVDRLRPLALQRQVRVDLAGDGAMAVSGDATLLAPLFRNLLENAIVYNHPEGTVTIRLEQQESVAVATVADTGPGIPAPALPHLFERFYRGEPGHRGPGGAPARRDGDGSEPDRQRFHLHRALARGRRCG